MLVLGRAVHKASKPSSANAIPITVRVWLPITLLLRRECITRLLSTEISRSVKWLKSVILLKKKESNYIILFFLKKIYFYDLNNAVPIRITSMFISIAIL